jgi:antitoxin VapB
LRDISEGAMAETAKVFWSGRSQAVRLPKGFRFDTDTVRIRRHGQTVILEPIPQNWEWLKDVIGPVPEDFERAATEQPQQQDRPELDFFE